MACTASWTSLVNPGATAVVKISQLPLHAQGLILHITVDKVIIAQDSLKRFINAMSPGTYASITKVDFKALDQLMIKPLGVYGSKVEIVRLLLSINAVNEDV
jgi:hypothetical protein